MIASPAWAQWTLPRGDVVVGVGGDVSWADREFFGYDDSPGNPVVEGSRPFPLRGRYVGGGPRLSVRAGFTDELELDLSIPFTIVSYQSDPVILIPAPPAPTPEEQMDFYQRNIVHLAQTVWGLSDLGFAARYRFIANPVALAAEVRLKAPSGYRGPSGTFGDQPTSTQDFVTNVGTYVSPANVRDDVTLGDGQMDIALRILFGAAFSTRTFVRVEAGYNLRLGDAGDQLVAALRAGQGIADIILLYAGLGLAYTVEQGRVIGVSVAATDPNVAAVDYGGTSNLLLREVRLQRDLLDLSVGAILRVTREIELNLGYSRVLWGRNTAEVSSIYIGLAGRTHIGDPPAPSTPAPSTDDTASAGDTRSADDSSAEDDTSSEAAATEEASPQASE